MSLNLIILWIIGLLLFSLGLMSSCDLDQIENKYADYELAKTDSLFEKGWIPRQIVYESMKNIYLIDNIDLNTFAFSYSVSEMDIEFIRIQLKPLEIEFQNPDRLSIPKWWIDKAKNMEFDLLLTNKVTDSIFIAIDFQENRIYGFGIYK